MKIFIPRFFKITLYGFAGIIAILIILLIRNCISHESPHSLKIWHDTSAKNVILEKLAVNNREVSNAIGYRLDKKDWNSMQVESPEIKISSPSQNISIQFNLSVDGKLEQAQCNVQTEGQYCSIRVTFVNSKNVHCVCDGMYY